MKINHPLMHNNFSNSDIGAVKKLLQKKKYSSYAVKKSFRI